MAPRDRSERPANPPWWQQAIVIVTTLAVVAGAYHVVALVAFSRTFPGPSTAARLGAATLALDMEPWNERFEWRYVTIEALNRFEHGQIDGAYFVLLPFSTIVRGDDVYRAVYQQVGAVKGPIDSRKAHVQHGREHVGGYLPESAVLR